MKSGVLKCMTPHIKLCGMQRIEDIETANTLLPDYIGYIFARKSRRYVSPETAKQLTDRLHLHVMPVGVFVDEDPDLILQLVENQTIRVVQLHGAEDETYIRALKERLSARTGFPTGNPEEQITGSGIPVIKAFSLRQREDARIVNASPADLVLLDSTGGGSGQVFDHRLLMHIHRPYFLAGGLSSDNIGTILHELQNRTDTARTNWLWPYAVDVSSGIETDGMKDPDKMRAFVMNVRAQTAQ